MLHQGREGGPSTVLLRVLRRLSCVFALCERCVGPSGRINIYVRLGACVTVLCERSGRFYEHSSSE